MSISRSGSVRSEQRSLGEKDLPPAGLRRIGPVASLLVGYSPTLGDAPSSRLATGQIGRNERHRIYVHDHLGLVVVLFFQIARPERNREGQDQIANSQGQ